VERDAIKEKVYKCTGKINEIETTQTGHQKFTYYCYIENKNQPKGILHV
jgi:hypothetical protein